MVTTHRLSGIGSALVVAFALSAVMAPVTSAANARLTFGEEYLGLEIGSECLRGSGAADTTIRLVWKSASGALKARTNVTATTGLGHWSYCSDTSTLAVGDFLKVSDSLGARTFTMPKVTLVADRVHDAFRGHGPANSSGVIMWHAGLFADYYDGVEITTDANGVWSVHPEDLDLIGGINAEVTLQSPKGDWTYATAEAPYISVTLGRSQFSGNAGAVDKVKASLRHAVTSVIKGRGRAAADQYGGFGGQFKDADGNPVPVTAGDRLVSNIASDANWIVPNITGSANTATDHVSGRCFDAGTSANEAWVDVYRAGGGHRGFSFGYPDATGAFEIDFSEPDGFFFDHANIKHGDRVRIVCLQNTGDSVLLSFRVP